MKDTIDISNRELDELFERYRQAPDSYVFVLVADACRKINRLEEALEICDRGISLHPEYASGHVVRGKCLWDMDRSSEASETFEKVLVLDENNLVALKYLGMIEAQAGRFDSARSYLELILRLDPENRDIKKTLLDVEEHELECGRSTATPHGRESAENEDDEVSDEASTEDELETSDELATATLADIFASQGYRDKARKIYQELLARQPANESIKRKIEMLSQGDATQDRQEKTSELAASGDSEGVQNDDELETPASGTVDESGENDDGFEEIAAEESDEPVSARPEARVQSHGPSRQPSRPPEQPESRAKPVIDEAENMHHFKRWLSKMND
ncbi:MAG: hypothetical protein OEN01_04690 [Candidatus Krumholzibacteria bacterium]|nr:hypothetical protein [Candidatus Krumholzibacteria bacterium]